MGVRAIIINGLLPQMDDQTEVVNICLENYLRCMAEELTHTWMQWLSLAKFWYNTSYHSSIKISSFEALYGYPPLIHLSYFPNDSHVEEVDNFMRSKENVIQILQLHLQQALNRIKRLTVKIIIEREFQLFTFPFLFTNLSIF